MGASQGTQQYNLINLERQKSVNGKVPFLYLTKTPWAIVWIKQKGWLFTFKEVILFSCSAKLLLSQINNYVNCQQCIPLTLIHFK